MPFGLGRTLLALGNIVKAKHQPAPERRAPVLPGNRKAQGASDHCRAQRSIKLRGVETRCGSTEQLSPSEWAEYNRDTVIRPVPVKQATLAEEAAIDQLFSILVTALHHDADLQSVLQQQLELAAAASVLGSWPIPALSAPQENIAAVTHKLADIVHAAFHLGRLDQLLPLLGQLMHATPYVSPVQSHSLLTTLQVLAEVHGHPSVSPSSQHTICSIMDRWGFSLKQTCGPVTLWSSQSVCDGKAYVLTSSQLLDGGLTSFCDVSPCAALQLPDATAGSPFDTMELDPSYLPQKRSRLQIWTVDEEDLMMTHELSPKVVAAYQLVSNPPARLDTMALLPGQQMMSRAEHNEILQSLGHGPNGPHAIRAYLKSHDKDYKFDFNEEVMKRSTESTRKITKDKEQDVYI